VAHPAAIFELRATSWGLSFRNGRNAENAKGAEYSQSKFFQGFANLRVPCALCVEIVSVLFSHLSHLRNQTVPRFLPIFPSGTMSVATSLGRMSC